MTTNEREPVDLRAFGGLLLAVGLIGGMTTAGAMYSWQMAVACFFIALAFLGVLLVGAK